jgi:hypothetical protein
MIFCHTRKTASWLAEKMRKDGHAVCLLSGELTVDERILVRNQTGRHGSSREPAWLDCWDLSDAPYGRVQCCGSGNKIRCFFEPASRIVFFRIPDPKPIFLIAK